MMHADPYSLAPPAPARTTWKRTLLGALRRPVLLLALAYAFAMCFERSVEVEYFKPYRLIGAALVIAVLLRGRIRIDSFAKSSGLFILIGFLLALAHVYITSVAYGGALTAGALWVFNLATYIAIASALRTRHEVVLVAAAHALGMLLAAWNISAGGAEDPLLARQFGDFSNPANACVGMLFAAITLLALAKARPARGARAARALRGLALVVMVLFFLYTASRTGSRAGAGLLIVGLLTYFWVRSRKAALLVGMFALLGGVISATVPEEFWRDSGSSLTETNILALRVEKKGFDTTRLYLWKSGLDAWADTYGLGLGMTMYQTVHKEYYATYAGDGGDIRWLDADLSLHNDYVRALVEFGVFGFIVFLVMCRRLYRNARSIADPGARAIGLALLAGLVINGLSHNGLSYYSVWFYFGLMSAWLVVERNEAAALAAARRPA